MTGWMTGMRGADRATELVWSMYRTVLYRARGDWGSAADSDKYCSVRYRGRERVQAAVLVPHSCGRCMDGCGSWRVGRVGEGGMGDLARGREHGVALVSAAKVQQQARHVCEWSRTSRVLNMSEL